MSLRKLAKGAYAFVIWPGNKSVRIRVYTVSATTITTQGGERWNRDTGMPIPKRMYQGQFLSASEKCQ